MEGIYNGRPQGHQEPSHDHFPLDRRFHLSPFIGAADSPEVGANPLAILGLPRVGAVIRHLLDSAFIHWRGNDRETERGRERELEGKGYILLVPEINTSGGLSNATVSQNQS